MTRKSLNGMKEITWFKSPKRGLITWLKRGIEGANRINSRSWVFGRRGPYSMDLYVLKRLSSFRSRKKGVRRGVKRRLWSVENLSKTGSTAWVINETNNKRKVRGILTRSVKKTVSTLVASSTVTNSNMTLSITTCTC